MNEIVICIFITLVIIGFIIMTKKIYNNNKKNYSTLFEFISRNIDFLTYHENIQYMNMLKETGTLFSYYQRISSDLNFNYMSFFKYDYTKGYISLDFLFTMNNSGKLIDDRVLDELPVTSSKIATTILRSDKDFNYIYLDDIKSLNHNKDIYNIFKERSVHKIYYKKIYNEVDRLGFFFVTYTEEHTMSDDEQKIFLDVMNHVKTLI